MRYYKDQLGNWHPESGLGAFTPAEVSYNRFPKGGEKWANSRNSPPPYPCPSGMTRRTTPSSCAPGEYGMPNIYHPDCVECDVPCLYHQDTLRFGMQTKDNCLKYSGTIRQDLCGMFSVADRQRVLDTGKRAEAGSTQTQPDKRVDAILADASLYSMVDAVRTRLNLSREIHTYEDDRTAADLLYSIAFWCNPANLNRPQGIYATVAFDTSYTTPHSVQSIPGQAPLQGTDGRWYTLDGLSGWFTWNGRSWCRPAEIATQFTRK